VIAVNGRHIEFKISARDEIEEIGNGTYQRTVIKLASFNDHLANKAKR
jgi:fluoroacetyl-CoA thioesterase